MKRFCRENPVERLGYQKDGILDIKKHKWFQVNKTQNIFQCLIYYIFFKENFRESQFGSVHLSINCDIIFARRLIGTTGWRPVRW